MPEIFFILLCSCGALYFINAMRTRELAISFARRRCTELELQLLDQTVSSAKTQIIRAIGGGLHLRRTYTFDFTATGDERYHGSISMLGNRVDSIELQAHRLPEIQDII